MRFTILYILFFFIVQAEAQVLINEVMYTNRTGIELEDGSTPDWVELYNAGSDTVSLKGWGLTDNPDHLFKFTFSEITLPPKSHLLVMATGRSSVENQPELPFKFGVMEEPVILTKPNGQQADIFEISCVPADKSAARIPDGAHCWKVIINPSPGASNENAIEYNLNYIADTLIISETGGLFAENFEVSLTHSHAGNKVFYTLDGDVPDEEDYLYSGLVEIKDRTPEANNFAEKELSPAYTPPESQIFKATVLNAVVYSDGCPASNVISESFLVHPHVYKKYPEAKIFSIITDGDNLFSDEEGIYVSGNHQNSTRKGSEWEREVKVQVFDSNGEKLIDQYAGARMHGRGTRLAAQKSIRLYAKDKYGKDSFDYPFFANRNGIDSYNRLLLRTTAGDWMDVMFNDELAHSLLEDMDIEYMSSAPAIVFINGEYWGIHNLREYQDDNYLKQQYPNLAVPIDVIDHRGGENLRADEGDFTAYNRLIEQLSRQVSEEEMFEIIDREIDVDNALDYFVTQIYLSNVDFPEINYKMWRPQEEGGKWRWIIYDLDASFFRINYDHIVDYFEEYEYYERYSETSLFIFRRLMNNSIFREKFRDRMYLYMQTVFSPANIIHKLDSFQTLYEPLMMEHIQRWKNPENFQMWMYNIQKIRSFAVQRQVEVSNQLEKYFGEPFEIYPIPAASTLYLRSGLFDVNKAIVRIYDLTGKQVLTTSFEEGGQILSLDISDLRAGTYLAYIHAGPYQYNHKIVKLYE